MPISDTLVSTSDPTINDPPAYPDRPVVTIDVDVLLETGLFIQANSGGGKSLLLRRIFEQTFGRAQHLLFDPEGEFHTLREAYEYVYAAPKGGDLVATPDTAHKLIRRLLQVGSSAIIDINDLSPPDRLVFMQRAISALVTAPRDLWHQVLVGIDEVQKFAPQEYEAKAERECRVAVIDLAGQGRKRGYRLVCAAQRISAVAKGVLAELNNFAIGRASLDVDVKRARSVIGFTQQKADETLPHLPPHTFFVVGPALAPVVTRVTTGAVKTTHPRSGQRRAAPTPTPAKVRAMLAEFSDLPAATPDLTDPEYLTRRVRELEGTIENLRAAREAGAGAVQHEHDRGLAYAKKVEFERDQFRNRNTELVAQVLQLEKDNEIQSEVIEEMTATIDSIQERTEEITRKIATDIVDPLLELRNMYVDKLETQVEEKAKATPSNSSPVYLNPPAADVVPPWTDRREHERKLDGSPTMTDFERDVLTVLAQRGAQTRRKVLIYARRARSGSTDKGFAKLVDLGWIVSADKSIEITALGRSALGPVPPLVKTVDMPEMQRKFLTVLAQRGSMPAKKVLVFAGYARSGSTDKAFAELAANDWTEKSADGLTITQDGLDALGPFDPLPTGAALRQSIAAGLDSAARKLFDVLCRSYPRVLTKAEALELAGIKRSGNTDAAFAHLAARDFSHQPAPGRVRAAPSLFE